MSTIKEILTNHVLVCALCSWFLAQILKFTIKFAVSGKLDPERLIGAGGMPSSHSAMVCSTTIAVAKIEGPSSAIFALAFILACVVMYDAMGVRRAAGEHAKTLNKIMENENIENDDGEELAELKEKLGHTPLEVLGGALLGILVALVIGIITF